VTRPDGREVDALRPVTIETGVNIYAEGSALITAGNTRVLCLASVEEKLPQFRKGSGLGWITAEYAMLPRATNTRGNRDGRQGRVDGRSAEIQRLIGRAFRAGVDMSAMGERTITVDCDVIQADAGTRCAAITGGFVALYLALKKVHEQGLLPAVPVKEMIGAVSVGIVDGQVRLDMNYAEDYRAEVDMNCVATESGNFIEIQGTAERRPFSRDEGDQLLTLASEGIVRLAAVQRQALGL
jgi:ribonuclease PH